MPPKSQSAAPAGLLLLGIDLEDVRMFVPGGERHAERVPAMAERYLALFARHGMHTTFFVVGDVARRYPALVREIGERGHEIACHTDAHKPLPQLTAAALREDLLRCLETLDAAGAPTVHGFRAPTLSLTQRTSWAYEVLSELGFTYSSSVLPGSNPLFSWPGFGTKPRRMEQIWELPVSVLPVPRLPLPFASGIYLRVLPGPVIRAAAHYFQERELPVIGYVHPYDVDTEQERFKHPFTEHNPLYHALMFYNRGSTLPKLESLIERGMRIERYDTYVATLGDTGSAGA
jgi:polysaccharide deacetylase family protein (PEP-CTERM system associated)